MKNWKTTIIGGLLAAVTAVGLYQANGGSLADWKLWLIPALLAFLGYLAKDAGVTGALKILVMGLVCTTLMSCATRPDGTKTFGGLDAAQWGGVAVKTGSAYLDTRKQPVMVIPAGGKTPVLVEPQPAEPGWLGWGLNLLGL